MSKTTVLTITVAALGLALAPVPRTGSEETPKNGAVVAFERIKTLAGRWALDGDDSGRVQSIWRVTAGGSAVMETVFPGEAHEMLTVFYVDGDELRLTHYCMLGNQPEMKAVNPGPGGTLKFAFAGGSNIAPAKDTHMHEAIYEFKDAGNYATTWTLFEAGKAKEDHGFELVRMPETKSASD